MSDNVSAYKIRILSEAEMSGMDTAKKSLSDLGKEAAATGNVTKLSAEEAEAAAKKTEDAAKKGAHAVHEAGIAGRTAAHGIHLFGEAVAQIDPQLGGIGELARMARSPEFLVPAGALIAWKMLNDMMKEMVAQQQAVVEWNRQMQQSHKEASEEAVRGIRTEAAAYALSLQHQLDGENQLRQALDQRLKMFNTEVDHQMQLMGIESQRFEAYIKYLESIGKLTGPQAEALINAHKLAEDDAKEKADERKAQAVIDAKRTERDADAQAQLEQPGKLRSARAEVEAADEAARKKAADLEQEKGHYKDMDAKAKEAEERVQMFNQINATWNNPNAGAAEKAAAIATRGQMMMEDAIRGSSPDQNIKLAKDLRAAADTEKARIESMTNEKATLDDRLKSAQAALKQIEDDGTRMAKAVHDLTNEISDAVRDLAQKKAGYAESRPEAQRATQAKGFYERGPADRESQELFNTAGSSSNATAAALQKVITESTSQITANRHHIADDNLVDAAVNHIVAIFASHAELTAQQSQRLLDLERDLLAVHHQLQVNRSSQ